MGRDALRALPSRVARAPSFSCADGKVVTFSCWRIVVGGVSLCAGLTLLQVHAQGVAPAMPTTPAAPSTRAIARSVESVPALTSTGTSDSPLSDGTAASAPVTAPASTAVPAAAPRNGYAVQLKPTVRRPSAAIRPYAPITPQNDQSLIPEIEMFVGESRVFPAPGVARIAVGNGQIMSAAALDEKEVIVFANGVGTSSLFVWNADGRYQRVKVSIVPGDTTRIAREVTAFLKTMPGTRTSIIGDKVIIEGDKLSDVELAKIDMLEKRYPQIINFTNQIGWEPMVMLDVKVVEFPTSELRDIGLKWGSVGGAAIGAIWSPGRRGTDGPYQINIQSANTAPISSPEGSNIPLVLPGGLNVLSALNLGLNAQLNLLAQQGKASLLAQPQLSARSGTKASFLAGGEFPYSVATINGVTVQFKPYGIKLDILPKVDRNGVIRATIEAEVSKIDASISTAAGPGLQTRKTKTEFNVVAGDTIVLAGMLQSDNSTSIDKVPLLGDVPILGALFRSKRFENKETELVVFVTPTLVDSHSPTLIERVERTTDQLKNNLGKQPYLETPATIRLPAQDKAKLPELPAPLAPAPAPNQNIVPVPAPLPAPMRRPVNVPSPTPTPLPVPVQSSVPSRPQIDSTSAASTELVPFGMSAH